MQSKPNIVFLFPDQQRHDFLSCYGADFIQTPNIDKLGEHGVIFNNAYSPSPMCVPARAALMTGMNGIKSGVLDNTQFLRPDYAERGMRTLPEMLSEQGYYTAAIGKMHFYPWDLRLGFQYRVIAEDKRWIHIRDDYYHYLKEQGYRKLHGNEHEGYYENKGAIYSKIPAEHSVDSFVGSEACRFLKNHGQEEPFFMMVGFPGPHCPYDPTEEQAAEFDPDTMPEPIADEGVNTPGVIKNTIEGSKLPWNGVDYSDFSVKQSKKVRAHYAALVKQIDEEIGKIMDTLEEQGLADNTIVIYAADHGDYLGDHRLIGKGSFYEAAIHVPLIVHIPSQMKALRSDELVHVDDVTATILHMAGCDLPAYFDSRPLPLPDESGALPEGRDYVIGMLQGGWMIYDGTWRLSKYANGETVLFNIADDPDEQVNLLDLDDPECLEVYRELDRKLTSVIMQSIVEANQDCRVYTESKGMSEERAFGSEGWQRPYPCPLES